MNVLILHRLCLKEMCRIHMFQFLCWCNTINLCVIQSPCCFDITNVLRRCVVFKTTHVVCNINTPQILECQTNLLHTTSLAQFSKTAHFSHPTHIGVLKLHNGIYSELQENDGFSICGNKLPGAILWKLLQLLLKQQSCRMPYMDVSDHHGSTYISSPLLQTLLNGVLCLWVIYSCYSFVCVSVPG